MQWSATELSVGGKLMITDGQALTEGPGMASMFVCTGGVGSGIMAIPSRVPGPPLPLGHLRRPRCCRRHGSHGTSTRRHHHGALNRPPARRPLVCLAGPARHRPLPYDLSPGGSPKEHLRSIRSTRASARVSRWRCRRCTVWRATGRLARVSTQRGQPYERCNQHVFGQENREGTPMIWRRDHARDAASRC